MFFACKDQYNTLLESVPVYLSLLPSSRKAQAKQEHHFSTPSDVKEPAASAFCQSRWEFSQNKTFSDMHIAGLCENVLLPEHVFILLSVLTTVCKHDVCS